MELSVNRLLAALGAVEPFSLPAMNEGVTYLYESLYKRMVSGAEVRLSELDFTAFESEDVETLNDICNNVFERNEYKANSVVNALRAAAPVCKAANYV